MKYSAFSNIQGEISKLGFGLMRLPKLYEGKEDIDYTYKLMKENMFDKLPKKISYGWLLEHGYFPFWNGWKEKK